MRPGFSRPGQRAGFTGRFFLNSGPGSPMASPHDTGADRGPREPAARGVSSAGSFRGNRVPARGLARDAATGSRANGQLWRGGEFDRAPSGGPSGGRRLRREPAAGAHSLPPGPGRPSAHWGIFRWVTLETRTPGSRRHQVLRVESTGRERGANRLCSTSSM